MATKKRTANRSRNGSSRRRASAASGLSVIARPPTNAARASGTPNTAAPSPASASPDATDAMRNRSCSSRSRRGCDGSSRATATATTAERDETQRGRRPAGRRRRAPRAGPPRGHPRHVLEDAPAEQGRLGRSVGRPPTAEGDVDDDDRRRQRDAEADERSRDRREPGDEKAIPAMTVVRTTWSGAATGAPPCSRRRRPRSTSMPTSNSRSTTPTSASSCELLAIGDVAGRERRDGDAEQRGSRRPPAGRAAGRASRPQRPQEQEAELEDRRCRFHEGMVPARRQPPVGATDMRVTSVTGTAVGQRWADRPMRTGQ